MSTLKGRLRAPASLGHAIRARDGRSGSTQAAHAVSIWRKTLFIAGLAGLLILSASIVITLGQVPMSVTEVYRTLANRLVPDFFAIDPLIDHVVWQIRLPLVGGAILAGFGLSACGCVMQAVLKNPMASPFTLGISSGAHFGVSLAAVCGVTVLDGPYFLVGNAFVCALFCSGLIIALSTLKGATSETLILAGIAVNYLFQAANQLFSYIATDDQRTVMSYWGMGSLNDLNWHSMLFLGVVSAVCLPLLYSKAGSQSDDRGRRERQKHGCGGQPHPVLVMAVASLLVAAVVSFIGVIGFIGLVAPHIGRIILGNDHRYLIPAAGASAGPCCSSPMPFP